MTLNDLEDAYHCDLTRSQARELINTLDEPEALLTALDEAHAASEESPAYLIIKIA